MESSQAKVWHKRRAFTFVMGKFSSIVCWLDDSGEKGEIKFQGKKQLLKHVF